MDRLLSTVKQLIGSLQGGAQLTAADGRQLRGIIRQQRQLLNEQREFQSRNVHSEVGNNKRRASRRR